MRWRGIWERPLRVWLIVLDPGAYPSVGSQSCSHLMALRSAFLLHVMPSLLCLAWSCLSLQTVPYVLFFQGGLSVTLQIPPERQLEATWRLPLGSSGNVFITTPASHQIRNQLSVARPCSSPLGIFQNVGQYWPDCLFSLLVLAPEPCK